MRQENIAREGLEVETGGEMRKVDSFERLVNKSWNTYIQDVKKAAQRRIDAVVLADKIYANAIENADRNHLHRTENQGK